MRKKTIKQLIIFGFIFLPLVASAEETNLILYDVATEIGVVAKKEYTNDKDQIYKIEFFSFRSKEVKLQGPFDKDKLILFETEYKYFNHKGNEILTIRNDSNGNMRMIRMTEYNINQKVRIRWFDKDGHLYQFNELKDGKWTQLRFK